MKKIILTMIKIYQTFISPNTAYHCRFYPSCSGYAAEAVKKHGALKGLAKGFWRILRCHPFNKGGADLP